MTLFIVSGTSGSGKSIVLRTLEDIGFYCIDNLPINLLPAFASELLQSSATHDYENAAVGIDARNLARHLDNFPEALKKLKTSGIAYRIVYLDADDTTLFKRFSETRRRHPLTDPEHPLEEAIHQERMLLKPVASRADLTLDTSRTNVHQLRDLVIAQLGHDSREGMSILFQSFGFKHGVPIEADFVFDVRCLPNPHWEPNLRDLTGRDEEVRHFLENHIEVNRMYENIRDFLETWIPQFEADKRSYMTIAIGCTGGHHRSVYFTERLAGHFRTKRTRILARHRELS